METASAEGELIYEAGLFLEETVNGIYDDFFVIIKMTD